MHAIHSIPARTAPPAPGQSRVLRITPNRWVDRSMVTSWVLQPDGNTLSIYLLGGDEFHVLKGSGPFQAPDLEQVIVSLICG